MDGKHWEQSSVSDKAEQEMVTINKVEVNPISCDGPFVRGKGFVSVRTT